MIAPILSKKDLCFNYLGWMPNQLDLVIQNKNMYYKSFSVAKKDKFGNVKRLNGQVQYRNIDHSIGHLKQIQKKIKSTILDNIKLPNYVKGGVKGLDNIKNAKVHQGKKYIFQTDIESFFPSIKPERVFRAFRGLGFSDEVSKILAKLTTYKDFLPQGNPTSTAIANLAFMEINEKIISLCKTQRILYTIFVDDLTISSNEDLTDLIPKIIKIISTNGFKISRKKTTYRNGKASITGADVGNNTIKPTKDFFLKLNSATNENAIIGYGNYKNRVHKISKTKLRYII